MRTADDFNQFYATPDPWQISRSRFRDKVFRRILKPLIVGASVLELGCGEGHLTASVFSGAKLVTGIDISDLAISRAQLRGLTNARFETGDFLETSFSGYDVIAALECVYYLGQPQREAFFTKVAREHAGKPFVISAPIIGSNAHRRYFTHEEIIELLSQNGFSEIGFHNLNVYRQQDVVSGLTAIAVRLPLGDRLLDLLPDTLVNQRCYIAR